MSSSAKSIWIGFDPRETNNYAVCVHSARQWMTSHIPLNGVVLSTLQRRGYYTREIGHDAEGRLWDPISEAPMSTEFAISRFLVPTLQRGGWALFMDCDMMFRADPNEIFDHIDSSKAVVCVKHNHVPKEELKKSGERQTSYNRKNWSSVMLFNCDHPSNRALDIKLVNSVPGRDLHAFCWLEDHEIGELGPEWNYLVSVTDPSAVLDPKIVHWTLGSPNILPREKTEYYDDYHRILDQWAARAAA